MTETKKVSLFSMNQKTTNKGKPYWLVETSDGKMSIWDAGLKDLIQEKGIGNLCEVGYETKDVNGRSYTNLKSLEVVLGNAETQVKDPKGIGESARLRRKTDCMIAAKDLVIAKEVPLDKLLDYAQSLVDWVEENEVKEIKVETIKC